MTGLRFTTVIAILLSGVFAWASCPDLTGSYRCQWDNGEISYVDIEMSYPDYDVLPRYIFTYSRHHKRRTIDIIPDGHWTYHPDRPPSFHRRTRFFCDRDDLVREYEDYYNRPGQLGFHRLIADQARLTRGDNLSFRTDVYHYRGHHERHVYSTTTLCERVD